MYEENHVNYGINHRQITLIDENGKFKGITTRDSAISLAIESGLDLVQFSSDQEKNPVCKIIDYGKYKYEQSKRDKKNAHNVIVTKEVRIGHNISDHDLQTKHTLIFKFLDKKYKVKCVLKLKGCPIAHRKNAINKFMEDLNVFVDKSEMAKEEDGDRSISVILSPIHK